MDVFKGLGLEIDGITGTISRYTSDPYINNTLKNLKDAVSRKDIEESLFLLEKVNNWYSGNIEKILKNTFAINPDVHLNIKGSLEKYKEELEKKKEEVSIQEEEKIKEVVAKMKKKLFISHSSKDEVVCTSFVELLETIGVPDEAILYTSSPRHGIPGDADIFDYLKEHLSDGITVFYMLSDNYYKSAYCLNEMGAAWVAQNASSTFILPNFSGSIAGVINKNRKAFNLSQPVELIQLKNKLITEFNLPTISETKWEDAKNKFLRVISI
ncbi:TIR domain-containing protein [Bacillus salipaludis]|uniref:TIR domain-containing protein n=1 Tax=Bacillus salipaludis TaxID=2547811 RepID=A0AA90TVX1_9BACI|nr:TIR domain-containing protein [Bacillus salipaludis]MDQ6598078.1 TIR domain-containing protein [Bacillus salipaludis]